MSTQGWLGDFIDALMARSFQRWSTSVEVTDVAYTLQSDAANAGVLLVANRGDGSQTITLPSSGVDAGVSVVVVAASGSTSEADYVSVASDQGTIATLTSPLEYVELVWVGNGWASNGATGGGGVTDHGALTGLGDDDHAQYVHTSTARTISAQHTFNPAEAQGQPFIIGANGTGIVSRLNSDLLDSHHGSYYTDLGNATGSLAFSKIDTSNGVDFGNSIKVGTAGGDPAVYADGDLTLFALGGDLILAAQSSLVFRDQTNNWGSLSKEYGLDVFLDDTTNTAEHKLGISYYALTTSGASGSRFKVDPVSLVLGTIATPEVSLGLTTSKVPLEFNVVGAGKMLRLTADSISGSAGFTLKDSVGTARLEITTTGANLTGIPRAMGDANNPIGMGDGGLWSAYFEDFRGVYGGNAYVFNGGLVPVYSGAGSAISTVACTAAEMGVFRVSVGTTATGYGGLRNGQASGLCFGSGRNYLKTRARVTTLSSTDEAFTLRLGWTDGITGNAPTDGAYFRYTDSENGGRWTCVTVSNSSETTADSGVSVAANTWAKLEIEINAGATAAVFKINGNTVATITTNIPSGSARGTCTGFWITKTAGTSNRYMDLDYVQEVNEFTTPR